MDDDVTLRFVEVDRYDPMLDVEVVRFMAITNKGTFHTEIPVAGVKALRLRRQEFKDYVLNALDAGLSPCEVHLQMH